MTPIQDLLYRMRWDRRFAGSRFDLGYYDRVEGRVVMVSYAEVHLDAGNHFCFALTDSDGRVHMVPFHRVKDVYKNGKLIWRHEPHRRPPQASAGRKRDR